MTITSNMEQVSFEENFKYYIYKKYTLCPNNYELYEKYVIYSPFSKGSMNSNCVGYQMPDAAYIKKCCNSGICSECVGVSEYKKPPDQKYSLAHNCIYNYYYNKGVNKYVIYIIQKVLVQLFGVYLKLYSENANPIKAYFSCEDSIQLNHDNKFLAEFEVEPALDELKKDKRIKDYTKVTDNFCCISDIAIYEIQFPDDKCELEKILELLSGKKGIKICDVFPWEPYKKINA